MSIVVASSANTAWTGTNSVTITKPTSLAEGDLMVAILGASASGNPIIAIASGWTNVDTISGISSSGLSMQYKIASAGDVSASDFTFTSDTGIMCGGILRITGHIASPLDVHTLPYNESASSATIAFTPNLTPTVKNSLLVGGYFALGSDTGAVTIGSYTSTPSYTWTEVFDNSNNDGTRDPVLSCAYTTITTPSQLTNIGATINASKTVHATVFAYFIPVINETGTHALLSADADFFAPTASAGALGTHTLLSADADFLAPTSRSTSPTQWSGESKPSTSWTSET